MTTCWSQKRIHLSLPWDPGLILESKRWLLWEQKHSSTLRIGDLVSVWIFNLMITNKMQPVINDLLTIYTVHFVLESSVSQLIIVICLKSNQTFSHHKDLQFCLNFTVLFINHFINESKLGFPCFGLFVTNALDVKSRGSDGKQATDHHLLSRCFMRALAVLSFLTTN